MELLRITRQIHCKAVEQRATLIHRQYNRDWGTSYSRPPVDPHLTSPLLQNPGGATAPQYLTAHCTLGSETASQQHLRSAASHQLTVPSHRRVTYGGRRSLSPVRRRATHCRNVYATLLTVLLFLTVFFPHFSSQSTIVYSALEVLARVRYINRRFTLHCLISKFIDVAKVDNRR